jgi:reverse gyrase
MMTRKELIYKYECRQCGWVGYKAELVNGLSCGSCGSADKPIVSTEEKEFQVPDVVYKEFQKAKIYKELLEAGKDPEEIDTLLSEFIERVNFKYVDVVRIGGFEGHWKQGSTEEGISRAVY